MREPGASPVLLLAGVRFLHLPMTTPTFSLLPNASQPTTERLEWLTDLFTSRNGTEARVALRAFPRTSYSASFLVPDAAARSQIDFIRGKGEAVFPLFPHAFRAPTPAPDAGRAQGASPVKGCLVRALSGAVSLVPGYTLTPAQLAASQWACPAALGRVEDTRSIEHKTSRVGTLSLNFTALDFDEVIHGSGYTGATSAGLFVLPVRHNWAEAAKETHTARADAADYGHKTLRLHRHTKRTVGISILLPNRAAVAAFRVFLFSVARGRFGAFRWQFPGDAAEGTWRLNQDAVEIEYLTVGVARCSLELTQLEG